MFIEAMPSTLDKMMLATYLERANSVNGLHTQGEFITRFPEILDILPYLKGKADSACGRMLDLYKRHAGEVNRVIDLMMARHGKAIRERTLPGECLLRIVYESGSVVSVLSPGAQAATSTRTEASESKIDAIHADVQRIKEITSPLPEALAKVGANVDTVQKHVRGVPILQAELNDARMVPESLALEIQNRIADILTVEQQEIWRAMRNADGVQKEALRVLKEKKIVNSTGTLNRRVKVINEILRTNGLPSCDAPTPVARYKKVGGRKGDDGRTTTEEISVIEHDWANDPVERDRTIQAYLSAGSDDQDHFKQMYPGIEDESQKHLKRSR